MLHKHNRLHVSFADSNVSISQKHKHKKKQFWNTDQKLEKICKTFILYGALDRHSVLTNAKKIKIKPSPRKDFLLV